MLWQFNMKMGQMRINTSSDAYILEIITFRCLIIHQFFPLNKVTDGTSAAGHIDIACTHQECIC